MAAVVRRAGEHRTAVVRDHGGFDLHGDLLEVGERFMPVHKHPFRTARTARTVPHERHAQARKSGRSPGPQRRLAGSASDRRRSARFNARMRRADIAARPERGPCARCRPSCARYFGARGPHLAAMLAYYALLSLFPFVFLAASLVSAIGRPEETSALLRDLSHVLPGTSAHDLARYVRSLESNAAEIGLIGGVAPAVVVAGLPLGARVGPERALRAARTAASCTRSSSCSGSRAPR